MKLQTILFTLLLFSTANSSSEPVVYHSKWHCIERMFITAPEEEINTVTAKTLRLGMHALGSIPGIIWLNQTETLEHLTQDATLNIIAAILLITIPAELAAQLTYHLVKKRVYFNHFKQFIMAWPNLKEHIPQGFHNTFETIYAQYLQTGAESYLKEQAEIIVPKVAQEIYERFPTKYSNQSSYGTAIISFLARSLVTIGLAATVSWIITNRTFLKEKFSSGLTFFLPSPLKEFKPQGQSQSTQKQPNPEQQVLPQTITPDTSSKTSNPQPSTGQMTASPSTEEQVNPEQQVLPQTITPDTSPKASDPQPSTSQMTASPSTEEQVNQEQQVQPPPTPPKKSRKPKGHGRGDPKKGTATQDFENSMRDLQQCIEKTTKKEES